MNRHSLRLYSMILLGLLCTACATPQLDQRIKFLRAQIAEQQVALKPLADPYRATLGKDVQIDMSGKPLEDVIETFNSLPANDRLIALQSYARRGYIAQGWGGCPWPLHGHYGYTLHVWTDHGFAAAIFVNHIDHSWNQSDGLAFRLKQSVGAAGMIIGAHIDTCVKSFDVPFGLAAVIAGANSAAGNTDIAPVDGGLEYHVHLTQPIYLVGVVVTPVFTAPVGLWFKTELTKGKIKNLMGKQGSIQIGKTGEIRQYSLDIKADEAHFLPDGMSASGHVTVNWLPPL